MFFYLQINVLTSVGAGNKKKICFVMLDNICVMAFL